jgi:acetyltransferase
MPPDLSQWERHDTLPDGTHALVRPLRPEDAALYPDFISEVTLEDSRLRFFAPLHQLSEQRISEFTHLDYERAMAFIALDETSGRMLGVVRLHLDDDRKAGEYAIIVRSWLKGHGLGWLLMQHIIEYAKAIGLRRVHGQVLAENTTMLRMCSELGFQIATSSTSAAIKRVTLNLGADLPQ